MAATKKSTSTTTSTKKSDHPTVSSLLLCDCVRAYLFICNI